MSLIDRLVDGQAERQSTPIVALAYRAFAKLEELVEVTRGQDIDEQFRLVTETVTVDAAGNATLTVQPAMGVTWEFHAAAVELDTAAGIVVRLGSRAILAVPVGDFVDDVAKLDLDDLVLAHNMTLNIAVTGQAVGSQVQFTATATQTREVGRPTRGG